MTEKGSRDGLRKGHHGIGNIDPGRTRKSPARDQDLTLQRAKHWQPPLSGPVSRLSLSPGSLFLAQPGAGSSWTSSLLSPWPSPSSLACQLTGWPLSVLSTACGGVLDGLLTPKVIGSTRGQAHPRRLEAWKTAQSAPAA